MNRDTERQLLQHCLALSQKKSTTLSEVERQSDTARYRCPERFELELAKIHQLFPFPIAHCSEIPTNDNVISRLTPLGNLIITRDKTGQGHVFHNACRHRGAVLVSDKSKIGKRITCPYHAWSYATDGKLVSVPGQHHCFPNLDKSQNGLLEIPSVEKHGFIWVCPQPSEHPEKHLETYLKEMAPALDWLKPEKMTLFKRHTKIWRANWKILAEGGIETYHFSYAHKETIGPAFLNNTAVIDPLGHHLRVVMPTKALREVAARPIERQHIRDCSHILYLLFPSSVLLVQHQHIDWIYFRPIAVDQTEIHLATLVPAEQLASRHEHWLSNHDITLKVLAEDFVLGEGVQASMSNSAMQHINYGRNEWALKHLNDQIDSYLEQ